MTVSIQLIRIPEGEAVTHREYYANAMPFVIGREYDCDLVLNDSGTLISRQHAELRRTAAGDLEIVDRSTNGTVVNGGKLSTGEMMTLSDGDRVTIGDYELLFSLSNIQSAQTPLPERSTSALPKRPFGLNTGIYGRTLIHTEKELESEIIPEPDTFTEGGLDIESELLFDPFATGPEMQEEAARPEANQAGAMTLEDGDIMAFDSVVLDMQSSSPPRPLVRHNQSGWLVSQDREASESAIEAAVDRLLALVDPEALEGEYREYLGPFSRTAGRYWKIHKRMFARKRTSGEYSRLFKAMLAEEIKKR